MYTWFIYLTVRTQLTIYDCLWLYCMLPGRHLGQREEI